MNKTAQTTKLDTTGINCSLTEIKANVINIDSWHFAHTIIKEAQEMIEINNSH